MKTLMKAPDVYFYYYTSRAGHSPWSIVSQQDSRIVVRGEFVVIFQKVLQLSRTDRHALIPPLREDLSRPIKAVGQRLVRGGCVRVAGGGRPRGIGGQIQGQQHRWDRAAQSHQGNTGVRAAHRWGRHITYWSASAMPLPHSLACFCLKCRNINPVLWLLHAWSLIRMNVDVCGWGVLYLFTWIKRSTLN